KYVKTALPKKEMMRRTIANEKRRTISVSMASPQKIIFDNILIVYTYSKKIGDFHIFKFSEVGSKLHLLSVFFKYCRKAM
ncbi:hypothetical protein ABDI28_09550, partial [Peribacillus frigoritolerans]|uniref:hypothetical protein n=1 Tax=Peribacillus frigoritolerans TaxID=450367 RepID=UPI003D2B2464